MKKLIVKYIPRNEHSNTKKISNAYKQGTINSDIEEIDLLADVPYIMIGNNLIAYEALIN
jgi:hypothetical protein